MKHLCTENYDINEKLYDSKKTHINGKIAHVQGPEELVLLKCPCYPNPTVELRYSLSSFQCNFLQKKKKILKLVWNHTEEEMATFSSSLVWRIPSDRGARWATVHRVAKRG